MMMTRLGTDAEELPTPDWSSGVVSFKCGCVTRDATGDQQTALFLN
jgi:hypothetical protein